MRFKFVPVRVVLLFPMLCAVLSAPVAAERSAFSDTTNVVTVEVPITVTQNGKPVRGLTADNFEIKFDGKVQEIRGLEMIDLTSSTADPTGSPPHLSISERRHFLFLFDLANSAPMAIVRARKAASHVLQTMHPSDLVAVGRYDYINGLEFLLGFTTDRDQVDIALESLGLPGLFQPVNDPLRLSLGTSPSPGDGAVRAADLQIRDSMFALDQFISADRIEHMMESFAAMAQGMATVQGQVHIVYLTEGWGSAGTRTYGVDNAESKSIVRASEHAQTRANIERGEIWKVNVGGGIGGLVGLGGGGLLYDFEGMIESLRRAGAIVHSVDVGGLRSEESILYRNNADLLNAIAQDTGGELYDNFNDLSAAMGLILDATSVTYVATLQPQELPMDGEYRKLKVRLKDGPGWGTKVAHRAGFFAPRPFEQADDLEKQLMSAQLILGEDETGTIQLVALAAVAPDAGETTHVTLRLDLDGNSLMGSSGDQSQRQLQLFAYAFDDKGQIHDFFARVMNLDLEKVGSEIRRNGLTYSSRLNLDPGHYRVRVLVRDRDSGEYGVRTAHVNVEGESSKLEPVASKARLEFDPLEPADDAPNTASVGWR